MLPQARAIALFIVAGGFLSAGMAADSEATLASIDAKVSAIQQAAESPSGTAGYFRDVNEALEMITRSGLEDAQKFDRIEKVGRTLLLSKWRQDISIENDIRERRNTALILMGENLGKIRTEQPFAALRLRYAQTVVEFIRALKAQRIAGFTPRTVYVNMPEGPPTASPQERAERYNQFLSTNRENDRSNRLQASLNAELGFLEPKVIAFLRSQYGNTEQDRRELQRWLDALA